MSKGSLRTIQVNNETFKWIADQKEVRIYDENKKMHRINRKDFMWTTKDESEYPDYAVKPGMIRTWILNNILT